MHRDINQAAALLSLKPHHLRKKLRDIGVLTQIGELHCRHRQGTNFFVQTRSRWNPSIQSYSHYGVVMITENGIAWVAQQMAIQIRKMPLKNVA